MTFPKPHSRSVATLQGWGRFLALEGGTCLLHPNPHHSSSHILQAIELHIKLLIIPLYDAELVVIYADKGIDEVGAQIGVHIVEQEVSGPSTGALNFNSC